MAMLPVRSLTPTAIPLLFAKDPAAYTFYSCPHATHY